MKIYFVLTLWLCVIHVSQGQEDRRKLYKLTIKDLMEAKSVIATRKKQHIDEAPSVVTTLTRQQLELKGIKTLHEALNLVPGFVPYLSTNGNRSVVVRGIMSLDGVLVMYNGVPMNDAIDGSFSFYDLPLNAVDRIEIIRGPGSALYGGYALAAVINVVTRDNMVKNKLMYNVAGGVVDGIEGKKASINLRYNYVKNKTRLNTSLGYIVDGGQRFSIPSDFTNVSNISKDISVGRSYIFGAEGAMHADETTGGQEHYQVFNGDLAYTKNNFDVRVFGAYRQINPFLSYRNSTWWDNPYVRNDQLYNWLMSYKHKTKNLVITPKFYGSINRRATEGDVTGRFAYGGFGTFNALNGLAENWADGRYEARTHQTLTTTGEVQLDWNIHKKATFTAGLVYENTLINNITNKANFRGPGKNDFWTDERTFYDFNSPDFPNKTLIKDFTVQYPWISTRADISQENFEARLSRNIFAGYFQYLWAISDNVSFVGGSRFSQYSDFGFSVTPRAGVVLKLGGSYLKFLYGSAFKPPAFLQLFDQITIQSQGTVNLQGNSNLKASTIQTFETSFGHVAGERFKVNANVFLFQTNNEIAFSQVLAKWKNAESRVGYGGELELLYSYGSWLFESGLSTYQTDGISQGLGAAIYPKLKYTLGITLDLRKWTFFNGLTLRMLNQREGNDPRQAIANTANWQTNISYSLLRTFDVVLTGRNLLDAAIIDATPANFVVQGDIPRQGRSIWLTVRGRF